MLLLLGIHMEQNPTWQTLAHARWLVSGDLQTHLTAACKCPQTCDKKAGRSVRNYAHTAGSRTVVFC